MLTTSKARVSEPATKTPTEERTRSLDETLPPHTVVLHNDD